MPTFDSNELWEKMNDSDHLMPFIQYPKPLAIHALDRSDEDKAVLLNYWAILRNWKVAIAATLVPTGLSLYLYQEVYTSASDYNMRFFLFITAFLFILLMVCCFVFYYKTARQAWLIWNFPPDPSKFELSNKVLTEEDS